MEATRLRLAQRSKVFGDNPDINRFGDQRGMFIVVSVQQPGLLCSLFLFRTIYLAKVNTS
jgi:hypothetical protein